MRKLIILRRVSQCTFLALFVYSVWSTTYPLKGALAPETFFVIDPLIILATALSQRIALVAALAASVAMIVLTLVLGRFFCGWVCPLGTMIDWAGRRNRVELSDAKNQKLRRIKYALLGGVALLAAAGVQAAWILDPTVTAARFVSLNLIPTVTLFVDRICSTLIRFFSLYGPFYDFYRYLKTTLLGVKVYYFAHAALIFLFFLIVLDTAARLKRGWCRIICPLGALYGLISRFALLRRTVQPCSGCMRCRSACRMGAIEENLATVRSECILCMDCLYDCPQHATQFAFAEKTFPPAGAGGISRRDFLKLVFVSTVAIPSGSGRLRPDPRRQKVLRPPGALHEAQFNDRCVRCGNCMKVCITNGLQPALLAAGLSAVWTPQLVPEIGYCEYHCTLCGAVCPTKAIPRLTEAQKLKTRLGIARIDRSTCLPWKKGKECIVCEEHCPTATKAIKLKKVMVQGKLIARPYVNPRLCIGCAICQTKCPVRPRRAIIVYPVRVTHADENGRLI